MKSLMVVLCLAVTGCEGIDVDTLQNQLDATQRVLDQTNAGLKAADQSLATTKFALQEALDQGFGPEALSRAQNSVFRAEAVVNDIRAVLVATQAEKVKWQGMVTDAKESGQTEIPWSTILPQVITLLTGIPISVGLTNKIRNKARAVRGEVTGTTKAPTSP